MKNGRTEFGVWNLESNTYDTKGRLERRRAFWGTRSRPPLMDRQARSRAPTMFGSLKSQFWSIGLI